MKNSIWFLVMVLASTFVGASGAYAADLSADDIVKKANLAAYYAGESGLADVKMTITDGQGRERNREFRILRLDIEDGGEQKFYVYFNKPSDVAKMVFMVWKHIDGDDDRWLYLPALDLVRRIASSDKRTSFVGSHFVYEDVSGRGVEADKHELIETTDTRYVVKNTPKDTDGVEFASYTVWIDKTNFLPMKIEYFNEASDLIKSIETLEVKDIDGHPTVVKSLVKDHMRKGETLNEFSSIEYDVGLTEDLFQERYLRRAPVKWVR